MSSHIFNKILAHSLETKTLIIVRQYNDSDSFYLGYVIDFNDKLVALQRYSTLGQEDGLTVVRTENIFSLETEDDYIKSYRRLISNIKKIERQTIRQIELTAVENWQFFLIKSISEIGKKLITIEINSDDFQTGYIIDFDETHVQLTLVSHLGEEEGESLYKLSDITLLTIDKIENRKREVIHKAKNDLLL